MQISLCQKKYLRGIEPNVSVEQLIRIWHEYAVSFEVLMLHSLPALANMWQFIVGLEITELITREVSFECTGVVISGILLMLRGCDTFVLILLNLCSILFMAHMLLELYILSYLYLMNSHLGATHLALSSHCSHSYGFRKIWGWREFCQTDLYEIYETQFDERYMVSFLWQVLLFCVTSTFREICYSLAWCCSICFALWQH